MSEVTTSNGNALLSFIERAARDPEFDVNKFALLLDKQQEMLRERARQEFNAAMSAVMADIGPVIRDRLNPAVNRKYATLEAIDAVARPEYSKHGFAVRFGCDKPPKDGWMRITCTVSHSGGYSEQNYLDSPVDLQQGARARTPVQAVGSTITYLRRYLLQMAFNIVLADDETDDDGVRAAAAASDMPRPPRVTEPPPKSAPAQGDIYDQHNIAIELLNVGDSRTWMSNLEMLLAEATSLTAVEVIGECESVKRTIAKAPGSVRARVSELLAKACKRFIENDPDQSAEELPEVEIVGEHNVMAGD